MMVNVGSPSRNQIMERRLDREHVHCMCRREDPIQTFARIGLRGVTVRRCCECEQEWRSYEPAST
jgi:hypothetical protein